MYVASILAPHIVASYAGIIISHQTSMSHWLNIVVRIEGKFKSNLISAPSSFTGYVGSWTAMREDPTSRDDSIGSITLQSVASLTTRIFFAFHSMAVAKHFGGDSCMPDHEPYMLTLFTCCCIWKLDPEADVRSSATARANA